MSRRCRHCGMDSDTDRVCSWCGKDLAPAPTPPQAGPPRPGPQPAPPAGPPPPGGPGPAARRTATPVQRGRPAWIYWAIAGGGLLVLLVAGSFIAAAVVSKPPPTAAEWAAVQSYTKQMTVQVPSNWKWTTSGSEGTFEWFTVKPGGLYLIRIEGSSFKGSVGDIGAAAERAVSSEGGSEGLSVGIKAEGGLHALVGQIEAKEDPNYEETSEAQRTTFGGKPAACSEYTTLKRIGVASVKLKGMRISAPAGDLGYDVRVLCPADHWDTFSPEAMKVLQSVQLH